MSWDYDNIHATVLRHAEFHQMAVTLEKNTCHSQTPQVLVKPWIK